MKNRRKIKFISVIIMMVAMITGLAACGGGDSVDTSSLADGTYTGRSSDYDEDESGNGSGYGEVEIEIKDNAITACTFKTYELDGTLKDETYGADMSQENRLKAQKAVQAADKYAEALVEAGSPDGVDTITGATISYNEFIEAVNNALAEAAGAK